MRREREQQQEKAAPAQQPSKTHHSGDTRRDRAQIRFEEPQQDLRLVVEELSNVVVKLSERLSSNQGRGNREEPKPHPTRRSGSGRDQNEGNDGEVREYSTVLVQDVCSAFSYRMYCRALLTLYARLSTGPVMSVGPAVCETGM